MSSAKGHRGGTHAYSFDDCFGGGDRTGADGELGVDPEEEGQDRDQKNAPTQPEHRTQDGGEYSDRHQLRDVVPFELQLVAHLTEIERVPQQGVDGVAGDEHLDRIAVDRQPGDALRLLGVVDVVDHEPAVRVEIEEAVLVDLVDVGLFHVGEASVAPTDEVRKSGVSSLAAPKCSSGSISRQITVG